MSVDLIVLQQFAVSFGLGLLLGLQRKRSESSIRGIRTFPPIAFFGTVCALLGKTFGGWLVAARFARARGYRGLLQFRQDQIGRDRRSGPVVLACLNRGLMIDQFYLIDALLTGSRKCAE
jgi:hypothetical protein